METKTAKVFTDHNGVTCSIDYASIEELMTAICCYLMDECEGIDDDVLITLPDGSSFVWQPTLAHYCFAHGCITEQQTFEMMLYKTEKEDII